MTIKMMETHSRYQWKNKIWLTCHITGWIRNWILIVLIALSLAPLKQVKAQPTIYPVTVRPQMIAGGSVYLGDFANPMATANRLRYVLTLEDPIEQERTVFFRLTIAQNGTIIASNPPGFRGNTVTLHKDEPYLITGDDLAQNLSINNLVGLSGPSAYGVLNEGVTDFCLEIIDAFRGEAVSTRQCASGYLTRLQPPMLILPSDKYTILEDRLNNLVFTWNMQDPLAHLPFSEIEYRFELRKQIPIVGAQDRFENHTLIFSTFLDRFSLFYNELTSQLVPGNTYIWRVTAQFRDETGTLQPNYFVNNGISRVGTFHVSPQLMVVQGPNYISCDCEPWDCVPRIEDYTVSSKPLSLGDSVRYGAFYIKINSLSGNYGSGKGSLHIPFLNSSVAVEFKNLAVNSRSEVTRGKLALLTSGLIKDMEQDREKVPNIEKLRIEKKWLREMNRHVLQNRRQGALPLSLRRVLEHRRFNLPYEIFITDINFNYNKASTVSLLLAIEGEGDQIYCFGASGVKIGRYGLDLDGLKMYLLDEKIDLSGIYSQDVLVKRAVSSNPSQGTFIQFDCDGLEKFNLQAEYIKDNTDEPDLRILTLVGKEWGDFTVED